VKAQLGEWGIHHVNVLPLGVDTGRFDPARRDAGLRVSGWPHPIFPTMARCWSMPGASTMKSAPTA
jgi:hypothetical protein